ncbi:hypothetical protein KCP69_01465 [Salmonella enterica subsp. enterica]|nr:hypothetical protein KCP69_01465 [Salmonella enterica subsp. enterica]
MDSNRGTCNQIRRVRRILSAFIRQTVHRLLEASQDTDGKSVVLFHRRRDRLPKRAGKIEIRRIRPGKIAAPDHWLTSCAGRAGNTVTSALKSYIRHRLQWQVDNPF